MDLLTRVRENTLSQFRDKPYMGALISGIAGAGQVLEDDIVELLDVTIDNATDAVLDMIGALVGAYRGDLDDDEYRRIIKAQILVNRFPGDIESLLTIARYLFGEDATIYQVTTAPKQSILWVRQVVPDDDVMLERIAATLDTARSASVRRVVVMVPTGYFGFAEDPDALGFDEGAFAWTL